MCSQVFINNSAEKCFSWETENRITSHEILRLVWYSSFNKNSFRPCSELDASNRDPRNAHILTFDNSALRPYTAFLCFIWLLAKMMIIYFPQTALTGGILPWKYRVSSENKESLLKNIQKVFKFHNVRSHFNIVLPSTPSLPR